MLDTRAAQDSSPRSAVVQLLSRVRLFVTPWTAAHQASLFLSISQSLPRFMSLASVMPSSHLILGHPPLLLLSIFPSIRDFSNESVLHVRWPEYWSFHIIAVPQFIHSPLVRHLYFFSFFIDYKYTMKCLLKLSKKSPTSSLVKFSGSYISNQ